MRRIRLNVATEMKDRSIVVKNLKGLIFVSIIIGAVVSHACGGHLSHHNHSCYFCSSVEDGDSCRSVSLNSSLSLRRSCTGKEKFCMVVRLDCSLDGQGVKFWGIERNCSEECEEGCIVLGERTKLYLCTSCCQGYLCNNGNGASGILMMEQNVLMLNTYQGFIVHKYKPVIVKRDFLTCSYIF